MWATPGAVAIQLRLLATVLLFPGSDRQIRFASDDVQLVYETWKATQGQPAVRIQKIVLNGFNGRWRDVSWVMEKLIAAWDDRLHPQYVPAMARTVNYQSECRRRWEAAMLECDRCWEGKIPT